MQADPATLVTLFADAPSELEKWLGPIITAVMAAVASLFAWLTTRDKYRFDAEKVGMQKDIANLTEKVGVCESERDDLKAENVRLWMEIGTLRRKIDKHTAADDPTDEHSPLPHKET